MDFVSNRKEQIDEMLKDIGIQEVSELWRDIPSHLIQKRPEVDDGLSEMEAFLEIKDLASKNSAAKMQSYLGGGAYDHYIPAITSAIISKSEFLTAYTPYQAEASQGLLQAIFEYQTAIAHLTDLDIANASVYDGASACAESLFMAYHAFQGERKRLIVPLNLHPHIREVIKLYFRRQPVDLQFVPFNEDGSIDVNAYKEMLNDQTAGVLFSYPNFFGIVEDVKPLIAMAKEQGAVTILHVNPLAIALYESPGELGVDIAVGDGQPLGLPLSFGGPYVGFIACKNDLLRRLPGRICGLTRDRDGKPGFVLTLQAREQHIRREKATSNICTNQALQSLAMLVTMLWYGKEGLRELALTNYRRCAYLKTNLEKKGIQMLSQKPFFNEFVARIEKPLADFYKQNILPGVPLKSYYPTLDNHLLINVTELKSKRNLDLFLLTLN